MQTAATLLVAAGANPGRLCNKRPFVRLCGVAPVDASSGKQQRHRLNRGGNRETNCPLHVMVGSRLAYEKCTRSYLPRRLSEGKTKRETIRCLQALRRPRALPPHRPSPRLAPLGHHGGPP